MKNSIITLIVVNRFLILGIILLFIFNDTASYMQFFTMFVMLILGVFHVITVLILFRFWNDLNLRIKIGLSSYSIILLLYFFNRNTSFAHNMNSLIFPIVLSLLYTLTMELLYRQTTNKLNKRTK